MSAREDTGDAREARVLELLLGGDPELEGERARESDDPALRGAQEALARLRSALDTSADLPALRESALVGRILARTTCEDLGWRGELRLFGAFVRERLSDSPVLRVVAAVLVLQLFALPVLAVLFVRRKSEPEYVIHFAPAEEPGAEALAEADPLASAIAPEPASLDPDGGWPLAPRDRVENALRRARFDLLTRGTPPVWELDVEAPLAHRLVAARFAALRPGVAVTIGESAQPTNGWERALLAELLLDRFALRGDRSPALAALLNSLALDERDAEAEPAERTFSATTLDRARAYGLWEAPPGFDPLDVPAPLARLGQRLGQLEGGVLQGLLLPDEVLSWSER